MVINAKPEQSITVNVENIEIVIYTVEVACLSRARAEP